MQSQSSIILPKISTTIILDTTAYWAAFYCSILKMVRFQKNINHTWGNNNSLKEYKGELRQSGFFSAMRNTIRNHAFEYVMVDFLKTKTGIDIFNRLCQSVLEDYDLKNFEIKFMNILKVGTDSEQFNAIGRYRECTVTMLLPKKIKALPTSVIEGYSFREALKFSDLFILISNGEETIGFVGEVEGNHGEELFRQSYFTKNPTKDKYCTFCIGVSDKKKHGDTVIKEHVSLNKEQSNGRWILNFSKSHSYIKDYHYALVNMEGLIEGHFGHFDNIPDLGHKKILDHIINNWSKDVMELIASLESFVEYNFPIDTFHYQETIDGKTVFRASPLSLPGEFPLYSTESTPIDLH